MNIPATVGEAQWILGVHAVQPNLGYRNRQLQATKHLELVEHLPENANCKHRRSEKSWGQTPLGDGYVLVFR